MLLIRTTIVAAIAATGGALGAGLVHADPATNVAAANTNNLHALGSPAPIGDGTWTVTNLKPTSDALPYQFNGTLWEATATDEATHGPTTPIVSNFNARARNGQTYRELFQVATAQGVNPSGLAQGQQASGKLYFDVTGDAPDSVVYNAGDADLAVWVQPPPTTGGGSGDGSGHATSTANGSAPAGTTRVPAAPTAVPASVGTPSPGLAQGTPLPGTAPGGPQPPAAATPAPQAPQPPLPAPPQSPAPAAPLTPTPDAPQSPGQGSMGTPLAPGADQLPSVPQTPAPQQGATSPAASTSTP